MPYDANDPRSQLGGTQTKERPSGACFAPQYFEFGKLEPDEVSDAGTRSWYVRSQNCCVVFSEGMEGDVLERADQPDEYMVLFAGDAAATISAGNDQAEVTGESVVVIPPGRSAITLGSSGTVVRLFSTQARDLADKCRNADVFATPDPNVPPFVPWPDPPAGHAIRVYPLAAIPQDSGRFGRLLRCSTIMVNYFYPDDGPRDPHKLSPHHHDDFEQISLQLAGEYVHHIRTPWTVDIDAWREDDHQRCTSPAVTIIPPPTIHTSQGVERMRHHLIDIFCPPRVDFSERAGWVLNHDEYPVP